MVLMRENDLVLVVLKRKCILKTLGINKDYSSIRFSY